MNQASPMSFHINLIFVVVGILIVLAMVMGRRNRTTQRASFGWWIGLGVLLFIFSGFLGFNRLKVSPVTEVRHSGRSAFDDVKIEIQNGIDGARESIQKGMSEVTRSMEEVQQSLGAFSNTESRSKAKKKSNSPPAPPAAPAAPVSTVSWSVEVKDNERKQKHDEVEKLLLSKATSSVNRWVTERMPVQYGFLNVVTTPWLQERGVFPDPIDYQTEEVPRANTSETDPLLGGTIKVVLSPAVQESLLDQGYNQLESMLRSDQFQAQWIISIVLVGITIFVAILGLVKTLVFRRATTYQAQQA